MTPPALLALQSRLGLTQAQMAARVGVSLRTYAGWVAGSPIKKIEHMERIKALRAESRKNKRQ